MRAPEHKSKKQLLRALGQETIVAYDFYYIHNATFRKCHKFQLRISELAHGRNAASEIVKIILPQV